MYYFIVNIRVSKSRRKGWVGIMLTWRKLNIYIILILGASKEESI